MGFLIRVDGFTLFISTHSLFPCVLLSNLNSSISWMIFTGGMTGGSALLPVGIIMFFSKEMALPIDWRYTFRTEHTRE